MSRRTWGSRWVLSALLSAAATTAQATATSAQEWLPIEVRDGRLTFPAVVEGIETRAVLNTGATINSIDSAFASRAGLTLSGARQRIGSAHAAAATVASEAQLDVRLFGSDLVLKNTPALDHPDAPLALGAGFLEPFVVQIDFPGSRMRILPRKALDLKELSNVPMRAAEGTCRRPRSSNPATAGSGFNDFSLARTGLDGATAPNLPCLPSVRVTLAGEKDLWLLLDTGAAGPVIVSRAVAKSEGWLTAYRTGSAQSSDAFGRIAEIDLLTLPSLRLGPFELADVPVAVPAEGERLQTGRESWGRVETGSHVTSGARANGRLGYEVLRHFIVTIDLKRKLVQVERPLKEGAAAESSAREGPRRSDSSRERKR